MYEELITQETRVESTKDVVIKPSKTVRALQYLAGIIFVCTIILSDLSSLYAFYFSPLNNTYMINLGFIVGSIILIFISSNFSARIGSIALTFASIFVFVRLYCGSIGLEMIFSIPYFYIDTSLIYLSWIVKTSGLLFFLSNSLVSQELKQWIVAWISVRFVDLCFISTLIAFSFVSYESDRMGIWGWMHSYKHLTIVLDIICIFAYWKLSLGNCFTGHYDKTSKDVLLSKEYITKTGVSFAGVAVLFLLYIFILFKHLA